MNGKYRVKIIITEDTHKYEHIIYSEEFTGLQTAHHLSQLIKHCFEILRLTKVDKERAKE